MSDEISRPQRARGPWLNRIALSIGRPLVLLVLTLLYRIQRLGMSRVPDEGGVIIISNHQSYLDPMVLGIQAWRRPFRPIARNTLMRFKPLGWLIQAYGAIFIERGKGDREAMRAAIELVRSGGMLILYPEGGRSRTGRIGEFHRGFLLIWRRTRVPLVPMAIEGAYDIWPAGRMLPRLTGRIAVSAGDPIPYSHIEHLDDQAVMTKLREWIDLERLWLRALLRSGSAGRYPDARAGGTSGEEDSKSDVSIL